MAIGDMILYKEANCACMKAQHHAAIMQRHPLHQSDDDECRSKIVGFGVKNRAIRHVTLCQGVSTSVKRQYLEQHCASIVIMIDHAPACHQ